MSAPPESPSAALAEAAPSESPKAEQLQAEKQTEEEEEELEEGEASETEPDAPVEASSAEVHDSDAPPLPDEPVPQEDDDGWDAQWDATHQAWFFYNRITGKSQWENPRIPDASTSSAHATGTGPAIPQPPTSERLPGSGYNPAIHGDYDPTAWYAREYEEPEEETTVTFPYGQGTAGAPYGAIATFNRFSGNFQGEDRAGRHTDEAKSRRQMNAYFDVDAAANTHDGRSLKAERSGKRVSKNELKALKAKRKARKEEKRRAWLRD